VPLHKNIGCEIIGCPECVKSEVQSKSQMKRVWAADQTRVLAEFEALRVENVRLRESLKKSDDLVGTMSKELKRLSEDRCTFFVKARTLNATISNLREVLERIRDSSCCAVCECLACLAKNAVGPRCTSDAQVTPAKGRCACGGDWIYADTEDWKTPVCYNCFIDLQNKASSQIHLQAPGEKK